ncbi:MAG: hypothetical protein ABW122_03875, partial [Ilumatobacteraceae bacterium]
TDPRARPHQLFLGGDQIYADDVDALLMLQLMPLATALIGGDAGTGQPVETALVKEVMRKRAEGPAPTQKEPLDGYRLDAAAGPTALPVDSAHFPAGHRLELTKRAAQFTSSDGSSHLISLGEFAAMYLLVWSNACWVDAIPGATFVADVAVGGEPQPLSWSSSVTTASSIQLPPLTFPDVVPRHLFPEPDPKAEPPKPKTPEQQQQDDEKDDKAKRKSRRRSHRNHVAFLAGLARVRRVLANVPTYMIFDDHDVTDDFFLNPMWRDRVLTSPLGHTILTNGMVAYALFQDWGNDPLRYDSGLPAELRTRAMELFPEGGTTGPVRQPFERLSILFGHDLHNKPVPPEGIYPSVDPPITWHFGIDGPAHRVVALDNRTRRSYVSRLGPPGNVSVDALVDQIPPPPLPAGRRVLVVIAPLQIIGPPVLDDLVAPLTYRIFDMVGAIKDSEDIAVRSPSGLRQMTGTNPDAIEAWAFDAVTFEHLLERLAPFEQVVLLSGDVHNSSGSAMSYWRGDAARPSRFVQFTSSGFKNVMPAMVAAVDRSSGFLQQLIRANLGTERIGWERPQPDAVLFPPGHDAADLVPQMRSKLVSTPVMIPTWGWPDDNTVAPPDPGYDPLKATRVNPAAPPDWRWRIEALRDERPDIERPESIRALELDHERIAADLADPETMLDAYQAIAARHQHALGHLRGARQILFRSNYGVCRFEDAGGALTAVHEVYTAFADPDHPTPEEPKAAPYLVQRAPLVPAAGERPPERLRVSAIEIPGRA